MNLTELTLWNNARAELEKGAKIPWDDPEFSRRMLDNHLAQEHDWASRRKDIIAKHTDWIAGELPQAPSSILDLGCGPGFYTQALAERGHRCVGVDFSPASIAYAREQAASRRLELEYVLSDIRDYRSEDKFDCIAMTFGEFNVFTKEDAKAILANCSAMLRETGLFILETHTYEAVEVAGSAQPSWQRHASGLFSERPHLCLQENLWNASASSALARYFIVDAASADVRQYSSFMQAYAAEEYEAMLHEAGLSIRQILDEEVWPSGADFLGKLQVFASRKSDVQSNVLSSTGSPMN